MCALVRVLFRKPLLLTWEKEGKVRIARVCEGECSFVVAGGRKFEQVAPRSTCRGLPRLEEAEQSA